MSIDDDDRELFRSAVGAVRRVRADRVNTRRRAAEARPRQLEADEARVMDELASAPFDPAMVESGEEMQWLQPGLRPRLLTRLRRGHWRIQDEIDLHQMNVQAASAVVRRFIMEAHRDGLSCVKIIHGKGLRSGPDGPRLKQLTARLLCRSDRVLGFASAPPHDGGTGAVYVLLDTRR